MNTVASSPVSSSNPPSPGNNLAIANLAGVDRIAEKTIELTACAQLAYLLRKRMVWFGLTQAQERKSAYDAATNLGGKAFYIQFKASTRVLKTGNYKGCRLFQCQHEQMDILVKRFALLPNACFYFFPNIGTLSDLQFFNGDLIGNSYLLDVSDIPSPVPPTGRQSDHHYVYLDAQTPSATITSRPFKARRVIRATDLLRIANYESGQGLPRSSDLSHLVAEALDDIDVGQRDLFFKNAALVVIPN